MMSHTPERLNRLTMIKKNNMENDNLPIEVLEAYDTIEKLLSPGERIVEANKTVSDCLLMILNKLYKHQGPDPS